LALAAKTSGPATATVSSDIVSSRKEQTMLTNYRSTAARTAAPRLGILAAAAALTTLTALAFFLLHPAASNAAQAGRPIVSTAKTSLGRILVNSRGHTLYMFGKDKNGKSACTGMCASFWPPLIAAAKPRAVAGAKASLLGTTRRADGRLQVTYNRHPLYTFVKDTKKGQTNGEGLNAFGAKWYAVSPAGAKVVKHSGGGGY
jgi:predicted lipoprotein with Yx(FWY)xxD motif